MSEYLRKMMSVSMEDALPEYKSVLRVGEYTFLPPDEYDDVGIEMYDSIQDVYAYKCAIESYDGILSIEDANYFYGKLSHIADKHQLTVESYSAEDFVGWNENAVRSCHGLCEAIINKLTARITKRQELHQEG